MTLNQICRKVYTKLSKNPKLVAVVHTTYVTDNKPGCMSIIYPVVNYKGKIVLAIDVMEGYCAVVYPNTADKWTLVRYEEHSDTNNVISKYLKPSVL